MIILYECDIFTHTNTHILYITEYEDTKHSHTKWYNIYCHAQYANCEIVGSTLVPYAVACCMVSNRIELSSWLASRSVGRAQHFGGQCCVTKWKNAQSYAVVAPLFSSIFIFKSHAHYSFSFICGRFIIGPRVMARQRCSTHRNSVSARALHDVLSARQAMSKRTPRLESKPMPLEFVWLEGGCKSNTTWLSAIICWTTQRPYNKIL